MSELAQIVECEECGHKWTADQGGNNYDCPVCSDVSVCERIADMERRIKQVESDNKELKEMVGEMQVKHSTYGGVTGDGVRAVAEAYGSDMSSAKHEKHHKPDPGDGYRLLDIEHDEKRWDDEYSSDGGSNWTIVSSEDKGLKLGYFRRDFLYRRKIEQPKFTGPTCEMTPELEARFRASCERIVEQGGNCHEVECDDCVGGAAHNTRVTCLRNRFRSNLAGHMCEVAKANAQRWLDTHPAPPKFTTRAEYIASGGDPVVFDEVAISSGKLEIFACFNWTEARLINEIVPDKFYRLPSALLENPELEILRMPGFDIDRLDPPDDDEIEEDEEEYCDYEPDEPREATDDEYGRIEDAYFSRYE